MKKLRALLISLVTLAVGQTLCGQAGTHWQHVPWTDPGQDPEAGNRKIHFQQGRPKDNHNWYNRDQLMHAFGRTGADIAGTYQLIKATQTEIFRHYGPRSQSVNRTEIRIEDNYGPGETRQIEAYVTFNDKLSVEQAFFQIWGFSSTRATLLQLRGHNGVIIGVGGGSPEELFETGNMGGREFKLNVIHRQETREGKAVIQPGRVHVYIDGRLLIDMADTNISNYRSGGADGFDYFKYGCYGTVDADKGNAQVIWKSARYFRDGKFPGATAQTIAFNPPGEVSLQGGDVVLGATTTAAGLSVSYRSDNPEVATIIGGKIRPIAVGTARIWAYQDGDDTYAPAQAVIHPVTVVAGGLAKK